MPGLSPAARRGAADYGGAARPAQGARSGAESRRQAVARALHRMIATFREGWPRRAEISAEMWTLGQGIEHGPAILLLARSASYVTISSPKTIRELSHVD
jgi:hypothetical protein